ncbi:MAG: cell surface protein SprA [Vicingaceae bacterium]
MPNSTIAKPGNSSFNVFDELPVDTPEIDLPYPFEDNNGQPGTQPSNLYLKNPSNIQSGFEYDPETGDYNYYEKIGDEYYRYPTYMDFEEYLKYDSEQALKKYWKQKAAAEDINETRGFRPQLQVHGKTFDRLFGGNTIDIRPQGSAELTFGINVSKRDNPILPVRQRRTSTFNFNQKIQLNVIGNIGEKLKIKTSYNTEATFDFENQMKIEYTGFEDEIIQKIEAGNVSLPLNSSLITGSQTLFGVKTELKFGRLRVTSVLSQERGEKKEIEVQGGAQVQTFEKNASDYEENKHYFLGHYFRNNYEQALSTPPIVNSFVNITKVEVWVANTNNSIENTRNIIGFIDLGEATVNDIYNNTLVNDANISPNAIFPDNNANDLYANLNGGYASAQTIRQFTSSSQALQAIGFVNGNDFEKYENARLLAPTEYTFDPKLGYISLNSALAPDEILAVAYQYTINGETYQVGEFSTDGISGQDGLYVKLLKGSNIAVNLPTWDLMMKNVYSIGAYNVESSGFYLDVYYLNPATGYEIPFIPEGPVNGLPLVTVLDLDRLNNNNQPNADGVFDYMPGVTINPQNGRIYFPVLEPFGSHLRKELIDPQLGDKYAFDTLYTTTQVLAKQDVNKNRFRIKGRYSSSTSSDISLNSFNIPQGSVKVTAGGATLTENVDYTVDYNMGRVKILNEGLLQSGTPIKVSLESNSLFNIQSKTLMGSRFDYTFNENFTLGGTILNLSEKPLTRKINMGNEPISNTIVGVDGTYTTETPLITRLADKLPLYSTKEKSTLTVSGEVAYLIPGNARAITKEGIAYLDDFEGSQTTIDLKTQSFWHLASTPQGQNDLFPEGNLIDNLAYGFNRAKLAWYVIDPLFWRNDSRTPQHIKDDPTMQSNHYMREVLETEVFPNKDLTGQVVTNLPILDLAFYPKERGPYNYDDGSTPYGAGLDANGFLNNPSSRWGGIMRSINTPDFESSNVEFIQFWVMDPFNDEDGDPNHPGGQLIFNLGNISEDILKDSRKSFENGLPTSATVTNVDTTVWGRVPKVQVLVNAFDNNPSSREFQDIGLDGLNSTDEASFFSNFVNTYGSLVADDPSADDYHYFRGDDYDNAQLNILERYKMFNGLEGNSPAAESNQSFSSASTTQPNVEDINQNNNLDFRESYYQYVVNINPQEVNPLNVGNNYITNVLETTVETKDGRTRPIKWYQFKIPIREPDKVVGDIQDFKSIRFIRMITKGFNKEIILRFARLELVRGEWRKYSGNLLGPGDYIGDDNDETSFIVGAVNLEENGSKTPVNYVIPPGILRDINPNPGTGGNLRQLNEQSLSLDVCNLKDGDARAAFKAMDVDIRQYGKLKMFIHAEEKDPTIPLNDNDLSVFIRMGTDFDNNYYEYEVPLAVTAPGYYNPNDENAQLQVWPESNNIDLAFELLTEAKKQRNNKLLDPNSGVSLIKPYEVKDGKNIIRIKGNPNIANVRVFMIGVRNPRQGISVDDDGLAKCAQIWVNELRLTDFKNYGGGAAIARVTQKVADLGNMTLAGNYSMPGWGSLEKKLNERQQETRKSYDFSSNVELGKFVPEKVGFSIPMYYGISESKITPKYNPLDPDLETKDVLRDKDLEKVYRDSVAEIVETYTKRKSVNFTNVRKLPSKTKTKNHIYDFSNFSFTYSYSEQFMRDYNTKFDFMKNYRGGIAYSFSNNPKNYKPFEKLKIAKAKSLKLLKEFNFYLAPKQLTFQTDVDRMYSERQSRNNTGFDFNLPTYYQKHFYWNRMYAFKYDITKSLKFDFNANNNATIYEPLIANGRVNKEFEDEYQQWKDTVWQSIKNFGTNTKYRHSFNVNYDVPIDKIGFLDWINLTTKYSGSFDWQRAPIGADSLGHTIQNSNTISLNNQLNLSKAYNKIGFLNKVNQRQKKRERDRIQAKKLKDDKTKSPKEKAILLGWKEGAIPNDTTKEYIIKKFKDKDKNSIPLWKVKEPKYPFDQFWLLAMSINNISGTYNKTRGTMMPGYRYENNIIGYDPQFNAPGFNFIAGIQEDDYAIRAAENDWLVDRGPILYNFSTTYSENYNLRATIRPINDLRIELNGSRNYSWNLTQPFFWNDSLAEPGYDFSTPLAQTGSYSMSFMAIRTAFVKDDPDDYSSQVFENFLSARSAVSRRYGEANPLSSGVDQFGYADGYSSTAQQVLIRSFMAGYSGKTGDAITLDDYEKLIPLPNWRVSYSGLTKIILFEDIFKKFNINHSYRSTFNVSSFIYDPDYKEDGTARDLNNDFVTKFQVSTVSISEQFSPLLGFDMTWNNNVTTNIEYRKDRNASLSLQNNQITEVKGGEISLSAGYKFKNVKLPFSKGRTQSDLDTRAEFSIRNNRTLIRKIVEEVTQITGGQKIISIKFTADYIISQRLNVRAFYDKVLTTPFVSSSFPTANTNAGISLRFTLAQ